MAVVFAKDHVLARWAYSEMLSGRYSQLSYVEPLLATARQGKRFDDLDRQQHAALFRAWNEV
jgi:hypothetical protein